MVDVQRQSVPYLRYLLETSAPHPFNIGHRSAPITFWGLDTTKGREYQHVETLGLLVEHQARIREFHIIWSEYKGVASVLNSGDILALTELNMPSLESLSWSRAFTNGSPHPIPRNEMNGSRTLAPQSRPQLPRITKVLAQCTDLPLSLRWPSLTELTLISPPHRPTCLELIRFLQTTPRMRSLHLNHPVGLTLHIVSSLPRANLPHLTLLTVEGKDTEQLAGMIQLLKSLPLGTSDACGFQIICPRIPLDPPYLMSCPLCVGTQIDRGVKMHFPLMLQIFHFNLFWIPPLGSVYSVPLSTATQATL
ncbi:hypothetical protein FA13DRAFT_901077 [Coprinellus micaceus]|uniref:Uncharacterized protein n=1 Tax=Coprinellus micaceus TaxID=71717 RepID=A0A4Y7TTW3_COPMI|nr:hypothetical protein FA13DRAFT_901077 [Coprinellus micaceus]